MRVRCERSYYTCCAVAEGLPWSPRGRWPNTQTQRARRRQFAGAWDALPRESVVFAVWSYLELVQNEAEEVRSLGSSRNEKVREAVANVFNLLEDGIPTDIAVRLAKDPVRQVSAGGFRTTRKCDRERPE